MVKVLKSLQKHLPLIHLPTLFLSWTQQLFLNGGRNIATRNDLSTLLKCRNYMLVYICVLSFSVPAQLHVLFSWTVLPILVRQKSSFKENWRQKKWYFI